MNTPVNFKLAKLLKEKGFDKPTPTYYEHALTSQIDSETNDHTGTFGWKKGETNLQYGFFRNNGGMADLTNENGYMCSAPTIADVIMWLYNRHQIWISVANVYYIGHKIVFVSKVQKFKEFDRFIINTDNGLLAVNHFNTPTAAYEAGIEYTLNEIL